MHPTPRPRPARFNISRRAFVKRCATVAAMTGLPLWFVEHQLRAAEEQPAPVPPAPNDRPGIALIGCGGQGSADAANASNYGNILAVCDVDANHAAAAVKRFTVEGKAPPAIYSDFRKLLERDDVHCIVNGTPDHWHSLVNIAAARAKKDIYGEKPLTLSIGEGRHVIKAVRDNRVVLQTGTQQRSSTRFRLATELVRNGRIGKLLRANVWLPAGLRDGPFPSTAVPEGLNWDFWQGQTPATDYVKQRCHTFFRYWYDYSGGTMTDWGAHHNDIVSWAVDLPAPTHVESTPLSQPIPGGYTAFADYEVRYTYPNDVGLIVRTTPDDNIFGEVVNKGGQHNGIKFEGTDAWIWVNRSEITASDPEILRAPLPDNAVHLEVSNNHMGNFFDCTRTRKDPICAVEIGHRSATICHLGAISLRTGLRLTWDPAAEQFTGDGAKVANTYLTREMRKPYDYSFVA
ncbi:MAG TPA: Gfo/Idh/MocA family oxidoreductase [Opitutus sp.]|nr:Gfo/Idh/MocA family oxidoreductase [Opitutus sp.]